MPRKRSSYRRRRLDKTSRFLIVAAFFFGIIVLISSPLQKYFAQRVQINSLQTQLAANLNALEEARNELELWKDPNYIKSQARARLHFVLPSERQYILVNEIDLEGVDKANQIASNVPAGLPWYTRVIATITDVSNK